VVVVFGCVVVVVVVVVVAVVIVVVVVAAMTGIADNANTVTTTMDIMPIVKSLRGNLTIIFVFSSF
jgi:CHASE3 domain sensor protein